MTDSPQGFDPTGIPGTDLVITGMHSQTSVYTRPEDGAKFIFTALEYAEGPNSIWIPTLLLDPQMMIGTLEAIVKTLKTMFGVSGMQADAGQLDEAFNPDDLPPPPDDPWADMDRDWEPPDTTGDR